MKEKSAKIFDGISVGSCVEIMILIPSCWCCRMMASKDSVNREEGPVWVSVKYCKWKIKVGFMELGGSSYLVYLIQY